MACSAVVMLLPSGVFTTTTPASVAAGMSTLSTPIPARPTIRRFFAAPRTSAVHLGAGADRETVDVARSARAARPGEATRTIDHLDSGGLLEDGRRPGRPGNRKSGLWAPSSGLRARASALAPARCVLCVRSRLGDRDAHGVVLAARPRGHANSSGGRASLGSRVPRPPQPGGSISAPSKGRARSARRADASKSNLRGRTGSPGLLVAPSISSTAIPRNRPDRDGQGCRTASSPGSDPDRGTMGITLPTDLRFPTGAGVCRRASGVSTQSPAGTASPCYGAGPSNAVERPDRALEGTNTRRGE